MSNISMDVKKLINKKVFALLRKMFKCEHDEQSPAAYAPQMYE